MFSLSVSNLIYHKFSHGTAFHTLNGKNINVMLEFCLKPYVVIPHLNCFVEMVQMRGHNTGFCAELTKIIPILCRTDKI